MIGLWLLLLVQTAHYRTQEKYALPDASVTPGSANGALVADITGRAHLVAGVEANLCAKDFRTGPWRKVSQHEKVEACRAYGIDKGCPGPAYELDHLISLEIGGDDTLQNLWPQPIAEARIKDHQVEDRLPKLVCAGKLSLKSAQLCVADDWVSCAARIVQAAP